jgi:hypothetical protein
VAGVAKLVTQVATPAVITDAEQPVMVVPEFLKVTVPVGAAPPPVTVAVSVVEAPAVVGDGAANRLTADAPVLTASDVVPVDVL